MSLSSVIYRPEVGGLKEVAQGHQVIADYNFVRTTQVEVMLNLLVGEDLLSLKEHSSVKSSVEDLKNYKASMHCLYALKVKSLCCYRTKLNEHLKYNKHMCGARIAIIECYEHSDGSYELRRVSLKAYMKHQSIEQECELPPHLLFVNA